MGSSWRSFYWWLDYCCRYHLSSFVGSSDGGEKCIAPFHWPICINNRAQIKFNRSVVLQPHQKRALYCHSSLPDDLGIQYQSYSRDQIIAEDQFISLLPGLGHTGSEPFDDHHGWYRSYRGLAGTVKYHAKWKGWSPLEHRIFPRHLQDAVMTMLMCEKRESSNPNSPFTPPPRRPGEMALFRSYSISSQGPVTIASLPRDIIFYILEFIVSFSQPFRISSPSWYRDYCT